MIKLIMIMVMMTMMTITMGIAMLVLKYLRW